MRINERELAGLLGKPQGSKYHNNKPTYKGESFDSNKELEYYLLLKDREKKGEIKNLARQTVYEIQPSFKDKDGKTVRAITYKADFSYYDLTDEQYHIIDVKGFKTEVYKLKKKLLSYRGIYIEEV